MVGKGIFEEKISSGTIGFKFGMYASAITEKEASANIFELFRRIHEKKEVVLGLLQYFYGGAVSYAVSHKQEPPTIDQVGDWIEEIGFEKALSIYNQSIEYLSKNGQAPKQAGQAQTSESPTA